MNPDAAVATEQLATMAFRYAQWEEYDVSAEKLQQMVVRYLEMKTE